MIVNLATWVWEAESAEHPELLSATSWAQYFVHVKVKVWFLLAAPRESLPIPPLPLAELSTQFRRRRHRYLFAL